MPRPTPVPRIRRRQPRTACAAVGALPDAPASAEGLLLRSHAAGVLIGDAVWSPGIRRRIWERPAGRRHACRVLLTRRAAVVPCAGLRVHRDPSIRRDHPRRWSRGDDTRATAFDLARWAPTLTERVAAVDALAHHRRLDLADVTVDWRHRRLGARNGGEVAQVSRWPTRRRSHQWSPGRVSRGARRPASARGAASRRRPRPSLLPRPGLSGPGGRVEYDGADHGRSNGPAATSSREAALVSAGWRILRFDAIRGAVRAGTDRCRGARRSWLGRRDPGRGSHRAGASRSS